MPLLVYGANGGWEAFRHAKHLYFKYLWSSDLNASKGQRDKKRLGHVGQGASLESEAVVRKSTVFELRENGGTSGTGKANDEFRMMNDEQKAENQC